MYEIFFSKQAYKTLRRIPRNVSDLMYQKLTVIAHDPYGEHNNVTKLQNRPGYRLRVGDWRIIYELQDDKLVILVLKIAPRGEIYR